MSTSSSSAVACPILKLAASNDILTLTSGTRSLVFDIKSGKQLASSSSLPPAAADEQTTSFDGAQVKAKSCKLVATGYAPLRAAVAVRQEEEKGEGEEGDVQPVVASITEDKVLRVVQGDTGVVFYERTLIKKASHLTIEQDGTVIVSDKNGDVFAYPFVNDAEPSTGSSSHPVKARPDPVALAGDPSLNPDATLLVGHVSIVTCHAYTTDKRYLVTVDRDEHRVGRVAAFFLPVLVAYSLIVGRALGSFVSTITPSTLDPDVIHTAGGDPYILTSRISTGTTISKLAISQLVKANRTVRAPLRKVKKRVNGQTQPDAQQHPGGEGLLESVNELPVRGLPEDIWTQTPDGWGLPEGQGICVGKVENVGGRDLVFFSEGTSAIHSVPAGALLSQETATPQVVKTFQTPYPVLDFCKLPSSDDDTCGGGAQRLLLSLDPGWRQRIDGGHSWFPPKTVIVSRASKKKAASASAVVVAAGGDATEEKVVVEETQVEEPAAAAATTGLTDDDVREMTRDVLMVLEIGQDGGFTDVTDAHRAFVEGVQNALQRGTSTPALLSMMANKLIASLPRTVDANIATQLPAYGNLAFLPKWASPEGDDDEDHLTPESIEQLQTKAASAKRGANAKRQIGRLKAQGIAVEVPRTDEQKMKRADANRERKKRKKEQKKDAGGGASAAPGGGEASGQGTPVEPVGEGMAVDAAAAADDA
ncbi:hypothetical protein QFC21_002232 [Naganishia friedmannii]|uniref:Uncharacterized protein n=1 Tax=Naganishia friedmannii TaxID=89922 RepID=A0ACC2VY16_9TREE|nr:hypothetical protein QFC21_002232 [Naganishia friedmannii]